MSLPFPLDSHCQYRYWKLSIEESGGVTRRQCEKYNYTVHGGRGGREGRKRCAAAQAGDVNKCGSYHRASLLAKPCVSDVCGLQPMHAQIRAIPWQGKTKDWPIRPIPVKMNSRLSPIRRRFTSRVVASLSQMDIIILFFFCSCPFYICSWRLGPPLADLAVFVTGFVCRVHARSKSSSVVESFYSPSSCLQGTFPTLAPLAITLPRRTALKPGSCILRIPDWNLCT